MKGNQRYLTGAMLLFALLLVGLLLWEWDAGLRLSRELAKLRTTPSTPAPALTILPEFRLPDAKDGFPEILSRPIFAYGRKPPAVKGEAVVMKKGQYVLVGVLVTPQRRSALLRDVQTNKVETVAQTSVVRGLTVGEIEPGRVVLRQGADSEELILNVQTGPKAAVPARIPAVPALPKPAAMQPLAPASAPKVSPVPAGVDPKK
jgi:hypothetical protein